MTVFADSVCLHRSPPSASPAAAQQRPDRRGAGQRPMGQPAGRLSAPRRPDSQPGRDGERLCQAGKHRPDRGDPGARRRRPRAAQRQRPQRSGQGQGIQRRAGPPDAGDHSAAAAAGGLSGPQVQRRTSSRCRTSSKAPRTASTRRGAIITRRCGPITRASAPSPTRSARRSSTAPSRRCRSRLPRRRSKRRRSISTTPS